MGHTALFTPCHVSEKIVGQQVYDAVQKDTNEARGYVTRPSLFLATQLNLPLDHGFLQGHQYSKPIER